MSPLVRQGVQVLHRKRNVEFSIGHNTYMGGPESASMLTLSAVEIGDCWTCDLASDKHELEGSAAPAKPIEKP